MLRASALEGVRGSLAAPDRRSIYQGLWSSVQGTAPTDNVSASGRRALAAFAKNAAFVVLLDRQPGGTGLVPLQGAQRTALVATTRELLENLNSVVEVFATSSNTTPTPSGNGVPKS